MKKNKNNNKQELEIAYDDFGSDENFYMIIGYTSSDVPYGVIWDEAKRDGLVFKDEDEDEDIPF